MAQKKNASIDRIIGQFKGIEISDISLVQSLHFNGNWEQIGIVLNKTYLPRNTPIEREKYIKYMKALGRLSNQYINMLSQPTNRDIAFVRRKFRVNLTNNYHRNLIRLGNRQEVIINEDTTNIEEILASDGIFHVNRRGNYEAIIENPDIDDLVDNLSIIDRQSNRIQNNYGISYYRVFMKLKTNDNQEIWVSTKSLPLGSRFDIEQFIDRFQYMIDSSITYDYCQVEEVVINRILEVRIEYY